MPLAQRWLRLCALIQCTSHWLTFGVIAASLSDNGDVHSIAEESTREDAGLRGVGRELGIAEVIKFHKTENLTRPVCGCVEYLSYMQALKRCPRSEAADVFER